MLAVQLMFVILSNAKNPLISLLLWITKSAIQHDAGSHQFSVGRSMESMTRTSMGSLAGTSLRPSFYSRAALSEGASVAAVAPASPRGAQVRSVTSK